MSATQENENKQQQQMQNEQPQQTINIRKKDLNVKLVIEHHDSEDVNQFTFSSNKENRTSLSGNNRCDILQSKYDELDKQFQLQQKRIEENKETNIRLRTMSDYYKGLSMKNKCKEKEQLDELLKYIETEMKNNNLNKETLENLVKQRDNIQNEIRKLPIILDKLKK